MRKTLITLSIMLSTMVNADQKELTLYKDLTHYKEQTDVNFNQKVLISLTDTAVLDTFNVSIKDKSGLITPNSIQIHPKSEENIFKLNKGKTVFINDEQYTLMENGKGFIKVRNMKNLVTFIPKSKIDIIAFTNDVDATSHIAQIIPNEQQGDVQMSFSYALGEVSWKPKYDMYIKDADTVQMDYNIEINNASLNTFEDIKVKFMLEDISRHYDQYVSSVNGGIFDYEQYVVMREVDGQFGYKTDLVRRNYDENGFDQYGYDRHGYDSVGLSKSGFNKVSSVLENGKRAFEFSKLVDVPAKAKTLFPFKNALEMAYEKTNTLYINTSVEKDDMMVPQAELSVENTTGVPLSEGVLRLFSGKKGFESTVIKELSLAGNVDNEDLTINIGDNYGIKAKVLGKTLIKTAKYHISDISKLYAKIVDTHVKNTGWKFDFYKVELVIDSTDIDKTLTIVNSNIVNEFDKAQVLATLNELNNTSDNQVEAQAIYTQIKGSFTERTTVELSGKTNMTLYILDVSNLPR
jgi:hypothetical protein